MLGDEIPRLDEAEGKTEEILDRVGQPLALQTADRNELQRETCLRDDRLLESRLGPDEYDFPIGTARHELARNRDRRVDMPTRAAAADHQCFHAHLTH